MHGCLFSKSSSELAALSLCDAILQRIVRLSLGALTAAKRAARQAGLPSRLLSGGGEVTPLEALTLDSPVKSGGGEAAEGGWLLGAGGGG